MVSIPKEFKLLYCRKSKEQIGRDSLAWRTITTGGGGSTGVAGLRKEEVLNGVGLEYRHHPHLAGEKWG